MAKEHRRAVAMYDVQGWPTSWQRTVQWFTVANGDVMTAKAFRGVVKGKIPEAIGRKVYVECFDDLDSERVAVRRVYERIEEASPMYEDYPSTIGRETSHDLRIMAERRTDRSMSLAEFESGLWDEGIL